MREPTPTGGSVSLASGTEKPRIRRGLSPPGAPARPPPDGGRAESVAQPVVRACAMTSQPAVSGSAGLVEIVAVATCERPRVKYPSCHVAVWMPDAPVVSVAVPAGATTSLCANAPSGPSTPDAETLRACPEALVTVVSRTFAAEQVASIVAMLGRVSRKVGVALMKTGTRVLNSSPLP